MDTYTLNLIGLLGLCAALFAVKSREKGDASAAAAGASGGPRPSQWPFFTVYALVMGSDWLQGPFLYSLYRDEHGLPPPLVSTLFTTGFLSGAAAGYVVGALADRHGRKAACLLFCAVYALSCALTTVPAVPLLFAGRVLGGLGTSLLFSVFESWMVADFRARGLAGRGLDLGATFGAMSTINSVVAIASGVGSEWLVKHAGTKTAPFWASAGLLVLAAAVILAKWDENYGETGSPPKEAAAKDEKKAVKSAWAVLLEPQVLSLGLCSTIFEGSMYLFVFFWAPALQSMQSASASASSSSLPYGVIFASFMAATLASSLTFSIITARKLAGYVSLLLCVLGSSSLCFLLSSRPASEQSAFWVFCAFEAAVGMYFPTMGYMKGRLVDDGVRAQVYGMLRVPLNVFVVVSLMLTRDGAAFEGVFFVCSTLLMFACSSLWMTAGQGAPKKA